MRNFSSDAGVLFAELAVVATLIVVIVHFLVCLLLFLTQCSRIDNSMNAIAAKSYAADSALEHIGNEVRSNFYSDATALGRFTVEIDIEPDSGAISDTRRVDCELKYYPIYFEIRLGANIITPPSYTRRQSTFVTLHRAGGLL